MNAQTQSIVALSLVALAAAALVVRAYRKRQRPGCGGDCGCPASEVKAAAAKVRSH